MTRNGVLAALFVAFAPVPLGAQGGSVDFGIFCTPGAMRACASVSATAVHGTRADGSIYTEIFYRVSNMQGQPGYESGPRGLQYVRTNNVTSTTGFGFGAGLNTVLFEGTTSQGTEIPGHMGAPLDLPADPVYSGLSANLMWNFDYNSKMYGCDVAGDDYWDFGWDSTCGGFITYAFRYEADHLYLTNATQLTLGWQALEADGNGGYAVSQVECTTATDCVAVVPEPITLVLLGSGLLGVGGVARQRRRDETEAADEA